jgi:hypothetical protein
MRSLTIAETAGSWTLVSFEIEGTTGIRAPWGTGTTGMLIYEPSGYMSVSINKTAEGAHPEAILDSILFYSGTYQVQDSTIRHQVTNASNPARIGKEMIRYAELDGDVLTLTTPQESFGRAILQWRKIV